MNQKKRFNSFDEAESSIKSQVLSLCETYSKAIKKLLPVLKKAMESTTTKIENEKIKQCFDEGNDHLHNLVQLTIELKDLSNDNRGTILEISSEVLANTVKYLNEVPDQIEKTSLFQKTPPH